MSQVRDADIRLRREIGARSIAFPVTLPVEDRRKISASLAQRLSPRGRR